MHSRQKFPYSPFFGGGGGEPTKSLKPVERVKKIMKHSTIFKFSAKVWIYPGMKGAWHFASVPKKESAQIKQIFGGLAGGWDSLPVDVTIRKTRWKTSIFPNKKSASYILPLKSDVRKKEKICAGDVARCVIAIRV